MADPTNTPTVSDAKSVPVNHEQLFIRLTEMLDFSLNRSAGKPALQVDETANDSDKTFTVPANTLWTPLHIWVELTTTSTVGNRQMALQFRDASADVIGEVRAGLVQAASLTYKYSFYVGALDLTSLRDTDFLSTPIPFFPLPEAFDVRVYDKTAVAVAADDMIVQMMVREFVEI